jgi:hypothetical protein
MQEEASGKLNYLGPYFVGLVPGQRPAKKSCNFVGVIRRLND